jgi:hypothetical protein
MRPRRRLPFVDLLQSEAMNKLHARKEAAREALLTAYVAGDEAGIAAAMATMREWCAARGFKDRRRKP